MSSSAAFSDMAVRVHAMTWEAEDVVSFDLRDPAGAPLPAFAAGAHVDVHVGPGCVRQYSLCNDPRERHRYVIAVLREEGGRGGSRALHESTRVGQLVTIRGPRNHFPLAGDAAEHLLLAGGIGITPLMAMVAALDAAGARYRLHYCTRSPARTAFTERLLPLVRAGRAFLHHDGGDPSRGLDLAALLRPVEPGRHVYYCGPAGFMQAARAACAHWPANTVHCEYFTPPAEPARIDANRAFRVRLMRSGMELDVPPERSIVDVLRDNGVFIDTSCEEGICGTCLTRYVEGEPEHRDHVLDDDDRKEFVLVCCARSKSPVLALDL
jgi:vanillate O-demethylase ferredoxin subunit